MRRVPLVALVLVCLAPAARAADWVRIDTPNFVVYGEVGEKRTREIASQFEQFREALGRVVPAAATRAAVPSIVVVFETLKSFDAYRPWFNGKRVEAAGYFRGTEYENVVALTVEGRIDALRVIFHEYTHLAIANVTPGLPPWLNEGLAEFYSTFRLSTDGRQATLGTPIASHMQLLSTRALMPTAELLAVTRDSPLYNEGQRRSLFYAQSWALVHYLMLEDQSRGAMLTRYMRLVSAGADPVAAWTEVFGAIDMGPAIKRYANRQKLNGVIFKFSAAIDKAGGVAARAGEAEMEAVFGDLLQWTAESWLEPEARFARAVTLDASVGRAQALIGLARARRGDAEDPVAPLLAAANDPDWLTQYYVATGLSRTIEAAATDQRARIVAAANRALDAVQAAHPDIPHVLMLRADVAVRGERDLGAALPNIRKARASAPGRDDYAYLEARILTLQGAFAEARAVLGPLLSPTANPKTREHARTLMEMVVLTERQAAERAERAARRSRGVTGRLDPAAGLPPPVPASEPVYRIMRSPEQRTEGLLERLECGTRSVTLSVRADGRVLRFTAATLSDLEFISYRDELSGSVTCGARVPPDHVYVTWVPLKGAPTNFLGRAVAVEFLSR